MSEEDQIAAAIAASLDQNSHSNQSSTSKTSESQSNKKSATFEACERADPDQKDGKITNIQIRLPDGKR